ncbi:hypothetical protein H0H93_006610, partial [Arthromyces matolae]
GVSKVHQYQQILAVPHEDTLSCLRGAPPFIPPANSWVRLTRPPLYKNDIAYVLKYDPQYGAKAFVVPRVSLNPTSNSKTRPPQSLLHLDEVLKSLPAKTRVLRESPSKFKFKTHLYLEGYRCLSTFDIVPAIPTEAELNFFIDSSHVTTEAVAFAQHHIASSRLQIKDRVLVTHGHTKGVVGLISDLRDDSATILTTHYPPKPIDVPRADLRKAFRVGDEVIVVSGPKQRTVGWVVSLTPSTLTIYSTKSDEEFEIAVSNANFYTAPQVFLNPTSQPPVTGTSSAFRLPFSHDPLHHLKGQEVTVTGANPFKGLEARVKETRNDGQVIVEVAANLRNVVVDPKNLSTRDFQPVPGPSHQYSPAVPLSTLALTASVPLPSTLAPASGSQYTGMTPRPSTTSATTPAWDPSAQTPIEIQESEDISSYFNPFMFSERFKAKCSGLRVKMNVFRTDGSMETGFWTPGSFKDGIPLVTIGLKEEAVEELHLTPARPRGKGDRVVVVDHSEDRFCEILWIVEPEQENAETSIVRGGPSRRTKYDKDFTYPTSYMAVVSKK